MSFPLTSDPRILRLYTSAAKEFQRRGRKDEYPQPNFEEDPDLWDKYWCYSQQPALLKPFGTPGHLPTNASFVEAGITDAQLWHLKTMTLNLSGAMGYFRLPMAEDVLLDIGRRWAAMCVYEKKELVKFGFQFAEIATDRRGVRLHCPELSFDYILGEGFVYLLECFIESAVQHPDDATFREIVDGRFDFLWRIKRSGIASSMPAALRLQIANNIVWRHIYLIHVVKTVLLCAFFIEDRETGDEDGPPISVEKINNQSTKMVEDMRERHKIATRKGRCPGCHEYRKPPNAGQPVPAQFFRCLPCAAVDREVIYCSVECQRIDYYHGHKAICGKSSSSIIVIPPFLPADDPPTPLGVRWQLIHQIDPILYHVLPLPTPSLPHPPPVSLSLRHDLRDESDSWSSFRRQLEDLARFTDSKENRLRLARVVLELLKLAEMPEGVDEALVLAQVGRDFKVEKKKLKKALREEREK